MDLAQVRHVDCQLKQKRSLHLSPRLRLHRISWALHWCRTWRPSWLWIRVARDGSGFWTGRSNAYDASVWSAATAPFRWTCRWSTRSSLARSTLCQRSHFLKLGGAWPDAPSSMGPPGGFGGGGMGGGGSMFNSGTTGELQDLGKVCRLQACPKRRLSTLSSSSKAAPTCSSAQRRHRSRLRTETRTPFVVEIW